MKIFCKLFGHKWKYLEWDSKENAPVFTCVHCNKHIYYWPKKVDKGY